MNVPITHINSLGMNFPITSTFVTQNNGFRMICVIVSGLIVQRTAKRGQRKGATSKNVKNRQKVSKIFSTLFDIVRAGQKKVKIVKKCQKYFRHFLTIFARYSFSGPFWGALNSMWWFGFVMAGFPLRFSEVLPRTFSKASGLDNGFTPEEHIRPALIKHIEKTHGRFRDCNFFFLCIESFAFSWVLGPHFESFWALNF